MSNEDQMAWQRQSFSKNGGSSAPNQMNAKLMTNAGSTMHSKIAAPSQCMGGLVMGDPKPMAMYADGGEVSEATLKQEGLAASKGESVGLWDRIKAGNIDDPNSEAYKRFGAGRGAAEREMDSAIKSFDNTRSVSGDDTANKAQAKADMNAKYPDTEFGDLDKAQKDASARASAPAAAPKPVSKAPAPKPAAPAPVAESKPKDSYPDEASRGVKPAGKTFAEDMAERKKASSPIENFDPSKINFGDKKVEPVKPKVRVHPRTGRPI